MNIVVCVKQIPDPAAPQSLEPSHNLNRSGKLILDVNVIADPSLGGVIDSAKVAKGSTLDDGEFTTCVEESMKSLSFDAPPDGRDFDFTYPFELAP